jgi:hypothetical protein
MDFWKDLPNVSGILLTLIGTAMIFMSETSKWLEQRRGARVAIAIIFVILGIAGIIAGRIDRKRSEREQTLSEERQKQLREKVDTTQKTLDKTQEMLTASMLSQEHMKGQLEGLTAIAGKIGSTNDEHMKQLVGAIGKVADTGRIGSLSNEQLCAKARDFVKRLREFGSKHYRTDTNVMMVQQNEMSNAKTQEERNAIWSRQRDADTQRFMESELEFRTTFVAEGVYLRDEITKRLPAVPQPGAGEGSIFRGISGGSWGIFGGADYIERLARTLCP